MKRGGISFLFSFIILVFFINAISVIQAVTSQPTGVSVSVVSTASALSIISPTSTGTYYSDDYILLDYTATLIDTVWYNLDNTANITINTSFYFQTTAGIHTLYLYGNKTNGTVLSDDVIFTVTAPSTGGGGKAVIIEDEVNISVEESEIPVAIKQGETKEVTLLIKNHYEKTTTIKLEDQNLNDLLISLSETTLTLSPGESREVTVTFTAKEDKTPDLYLEKIIIKTDSTQQDIWFYVEVESQGFLFDVKVNIPKEPTVYKPGEEILANVMFYNLGKEGDTDVNIEYVIKDTQGNIIFGEKQILIIGTSIDLVKTFKLPENIADGDYLFYVKATYQGKTAIASKWFTIKSESVFERNIKEFPRLIAKGFNKDKQLIAIAAAIMLGLYLILGIFEKFFGARGVYYISKRKVKRRKTVKRIIHLKKTRTVKSKIIKKQAIKKKRK